MKPLKKGVIGGIVLLIYGIIALSKEWFDLWDIGIKLGLNLPDAGVTTIGTIVLHFIVGFGITYLIFWLLEK